MAECFDRGVLGFWSLLFPSTFTLKSPEQHKIVAIKEKRAENANYLKILKIIIESKQCIIVKNTFMNGGSGVFSFKDELVFII